MLILLKSFELIRQHERFERKKKELQSPEFTIGVKTKNVIEVAQNRGGKMKSLMTLHHITK